MFLDTRDPWPPPAPWQPPPRPRSRAERVIVRLIALNLVLLLIAPIGGATLIHLALAWWRG